MQPDQIPINYSQADARTHLEVQHRIDFKASTLGATIWSKCRCGWEAYRVEAGWVAQEIAQRHRIAYIIRPLENRARYGIYRETCRACDGESVLFTHEGDEIGARPFCFAGYTWILHDRERDREMRYATFAECIEALERRAGVRA